MVIKTQYGSVELDENGYYKLISGEHVGHYLHRVIMKDKLSYLESRYPKTEWVVHHRNRDKKDDSEDNLVVISSKKHYVMHKREEEEFQKLMAVHRFRYEEAKRIFGEKIYNDLEREFDIAKLSSTPVKTSYVNTGGFIRENRSLRL